jgi:hypothetical protein
MSGTTCDTLRAAALDPDAQPRGWTRRPDVAAHLRRCGDCRDWLEAFGAGEQHWAAEPADAFVDSVLARTTGVETLLRDLPSLAEMDPGPGFAERVILATPRRCWAIAPMFDALHSHAPTGLPKISTQHTVAT